MSEGGQERRPGCRRTGYSERGPQGHGPGNNVVLPKGELLEQSLAGGVGRAVLGFLLHRVGTIPQGVPLTVLSWQAGHFLCSITAAAPHKPGVNPIMVLDLFFQMKE